MPQVFEDIIVDAEFAALIPPLTADERNQLEANISAHGCARDPLVVWSKAGKLTLVDGHNRYEICTRLDLAFEIEEMRFDDRNAAMLWIIDNQNGRRNLADFAKVELELKREAIHQMMVAPKGRPRGPDLIDVATGGVITHEDGARVVKVSKNAQNSGHLSDRHERSLDAKIGDAAGVSRDTVAKVKRITEAASTGLVDDDTLTKLRTGAVSINHVDKTVKKHKAEAKAAERKKEAAAAGVIDGDIVRLGDFRTILPSIPDGCVDLIFTDPPYDKETVPLYEDMAREAARILRPGGSLICYLGQYATADVCRLVGKHLKFLWPLCCYHEGPGQVMAFWGIRVKWKPMLWFVNGGNRFDTSAVVEDLIVSTKEKSAHPWQQSVVEARYYIEKLTPSGGLVVDPFCGGGTTAVAAKLAGRKWITCELDQEYAAIATQRIKEA
jgi:predicted methyltransferase